MFLLFAPAKTCSSPTARVLVVEALTLIEHTGREVQKKTVIATGAAEPPGHTKPGLQMMQMLWERKEPAGQVFCSSLKVSAAALLLLGAESTASTLGASKRQKLVREAPAPRYLPLVVPGQEETRL